MLLELPIIKLTKGASNAFWFVSQCSKSYSNHNTNKQIEIYKTTKRDTQKSPKFLPVDAVIVEEQNPGKLPSGVVILPIDSRSTISRIEDKRPERWIERS